MGATLVASSGSLGCSKSPSAEVEQTPLSSQTAASTPASTQTSKGFKPSRPQSTPRLTTDQRSKLDRMLAQGSAEPAPTLPEEFAARPFPPADAGTIDVYRDGSKIGQLPTSALGQQPQLGAALAQFKPQDARSVLVRGPNGFVWIMAEDLGRYRFRLTKRGQVKLEPNPEATGRKGRGKAAGRGSRSASGGPPLPKRLARDSQVRAVGWVELRSPTSSLVASEPPLRLKPPTAVAAGARSVGLPTSRPTAVPPSTSTPTR